MCVLLDALYMKDPKGNHSVLVLMKALMAERCRHVFRDIKAVSQSHRVGSEGLHLMLQPAVYSPLLA